MDSSTEYENVVQFIKGIIEEADELKLAELDYCIVVYKCYMNSRGADTRNINLIYKTLDDFKARFFDDTRHISGDYGIQVQLWQFD